MYKYIFTLFLIVNFASADAQNVDTADMYVKKDFLIIHSSKSYSEAMAAAEKASRSQKIELRLRGLSANKQTGLTISKEDCEKEGLDFPAYYARGRWDDGVYLSIEYSDAYEGFRPGYYIVIAASGDRAEKEMQDTYKKIRTVYKTAYFKSSKVYIGCMH